MTPERWRQIEEFYLAAQQYDPPSRAQFLSDACKGDDDLRRRVEGMLAMDDPSGKILDHPVSDLVRTSDLNPGTLLGPYQIEGVLGAGGMGRVYKARDIRLDRIVAVKVTKEQFSERFEREARTVAALNHPNICTLYDVGSNFLVMEFIEGTPLQGPLPVAKAIEYANQILDALEAAHASGVIHRDLKPGNILVTKDRIKLLDFGLAKQKHAAHLESEADTRTLTLTRAGEVMGTPAYMAPEQWAGKPADPRTDIYAFGCVLYEMLTGQRVKAGQPIRAGPPELDDVIRKCIADDPKERWQSATELKQHLRLRRMPRYALLAAVSAGILILAGVGFYWRQISQPPPSPETVVLAEFTNSTGDSGLDNSLREALAVDVQESSFLTVLPEPSVKEMLQFARLAPDTPLTAEVARSICLRAQKRVFLAGSVGSLASRYVVRLKAASCETGASLAEDEQTANGKEAVLDALHKAAARIQEKLDRSLATLPELKVELERATTPSLDALTGYSLGRKYFVTAPAKAIPLFEHALELDPTFPMAHLSLGLSYLNLGQNELAVPPVRMAFTLREDVSDRERYAIESRYYYSVVGDLDKARGVYESWRATHQAPGVNLVNIYILLGDFDNAVRESGEILKRPPSGPSESGNCSGAIARIDTNQFDEAQRLVEQGLKISSDAICEKRLQYILAFLQDNQQRMAGRSDSIVDANFAASRGQAKEFRRLLSRADAEANKGQLQESQAIFKGLAGFNEALYQNFAEARRLTGETSTLKLGRDPRALVAMVFALGGDTVSASKFADELEKLYPEDTLVLYNYLPSIRGLIAISRKQPMEAVRLLAVAPPVELGQFDMMPSLMPIYVRGLSYLALGQGTEAAAEFQKMTSRKGLLYNGIASAPLYALAHAGLARSYVLQKDIPKARDAYRQFLSQWKDADSDLPVLVQIKQELSALN